MENTKKLKLTFCGGTGSVTGANFLIETDSVKMLVDCGLSQGTKIADDSNWEPFSYDPKTIDILFITHSHVDHIGRIPKLVHEGFEGKIYSTTPTKDITKLMLEDTAGILGKNKEHDLASIYTPETLEKIMSIWETRDYHQTINLPGGFQVEFRDAGHILGSALIVFSYGNKKIMFTGDLGNSPSPLICDTEKVTDVDYLVMESVYGDRNHEDRNLRKQKLAEVMQDNYKRQGTLIMPTFSLERSQELLFEIHDLVENKRVPEVPIFLDSPLAIKLTAVYEKYKNYFNDRARKDIENGEDIFSFPGLHVTLETEESKSIAHTLDPKIIIAGSGMSNGGRIVHHEHNYLPNPKDTILLTGYQSAGTMGRVIQEGAKSVYIKGAEVPINATVVTIDGYSGHKDSDGLLNFVENMAEKVQKIFVVMGEPKSSLFLAQKIRDYLALNATAPSQGDSVTLDF